MCTIKLVTKTFLNYICVCVVELYQINLATLIHTYTHTHARARAYACVCCGTKGTKSKGDNLLFSILDNIVVKDAKVSKHKEVDYCFSNQVAHCSCKKCLTLNACHIDIFFLY